MIDIDEMENWCQENGFIFTQGRSSGKFTTQQRMLLQWFNENPDKEIRSAIIGGKLRYIIVKKEK